MKIVVINHTYYKYASELINESTNQADENGTDDEIFSIEMKTKGTNSSE